MNLTKKDYQKAFEDVHINRTLAKFLREAHTSEHSEEIKLTLAIVKEVLGGSDLQIIEDCYKLGVGVGYALCDIQHKRETSD